MDKNEKPKKEHPRKFDYMMLGRLQLDCDYFLRNGNGQESRLYYGSVDKHCDEMETLWNSFSEEDKPQWLSLEEIKEYREKMLKARR